MKVRPVVAIPAVLLALLLLACTVSAPPLAAPTPTVTVAVAVATPIPPPLPPTPPGTCTLNSAFVADVSVPPGTLLLPGMAFAKIWRLSNVGTCTWDAGTVLAFVSGDAMAGPPQVSVPETEHGVTLDVNVPLVAPAAPGVYQAVWQLKDSAGQLFGTPLSVVIEVSASGSPTPPPLPTPLPQPSPDPCTLSSAFVADVTIPPGTAIGAGQVFYKVWRMQNTGTCTWGTGTGLQFVDGSQMGGPATAVFPITAPGDTADIGVTLYAPTAPGIFQATWQLRDAEDQFFGVPVSVQIVVPGPNTPTPPPPPPPPTPLPGPDISFTADQSQVTIGTCTTVRWSVSNASYAQFNQGQGWQNVPLSGARQECLAYPAVYGLLVTDWSGNTHERHLTISTIAPPPGLLTPTPTPQSPPTTINFTADAYDVTIGTSTTLHWTVQNAAGANLFDGKAWRPVALSGDLQVAPAYPTTYRLQAYDSWNRTYGRALEIRTKAPPPGLLTPTPTPRGKMSISFTADSTDITIGTCTSLRWSVQNASKVGLFDGKELRDVTPIGEERVCPAYATGYRLQATDFAGNNEERTLDIRTKAPPSGLPTRPSVLPTATQRQEKPSISFTADSTDITIGTCTDLRWTVENASRVALNDGQRTRAVGMSGVDHVCPAYPTTYRLQVWGSAGNSEERTVEIRTKAPPSGLKPAAEPAGIKVEPTRKK